MTSPTSSAQLPTPATTETAPATDGAPVPAVPETAPETVKDKTPEAVSTPGGLPIVPAVTVGTTGTIAAVSAAGLAAGGGAAMLAAGALLSVPAAVVVVRATAAARSGSGRRIGGRVRRSGGGVPSQRAGIAGRWSPSAGLRSFGGSRTGGGAGTSGGRSGGSRRTPGASGASGLGKGRGGAAGGSGAGLGSVGARARQHAAAVRQTRRDAATARQQSGPTAARAAQTAARRQLADARRADRQQRRSTGTGVGTGVGGGASTTGGLRPGGRAGAGAGGRLRSAGRAAGAGLGRLRSGSRGPGGAGTGSAGGRRGLLQRLRHRRTGAGQPGKTHRGFMAQRREAYRAARDQIRDRHRANRRGQIEEKSRTLARTRALRLSAARHWARRVLAALIAVPVGALSLAMWPLAKLARVQPPRWGRATWRRLTQAAQEARTQRDVAAYQDHDQAEADRAREERPAPPGVTRARASDAPVTTEKKGTTMSDQPASDGTGFDFREAAAAMLEQAQKAEPSSMMQVLAQVETLPEAMGAIAETFAVVAEHMSPDNMPLHPEVNAALGDLHKQLLLCVDAAEAVGEVFKTYHEGDILRHTDGRTAEEMWDVRGQD
ncbi:hypothetical protein [Streptomyces liangshanensis]|uniref:hypothetical protein n=1 Tax=Streptomyces liangshanensis TaxID=2717324 RepID=UPI0036DB22F1